MTDRVIRVELDTSGVVRGARGAQRPLSSLERTSQGLQRSFRLAATAAGALGAALGFRELVQSANTFQQLQNSLRVVTDSTQELAAANERLFDIAQETRTPIEATVELFSRASIAAGELGASQEELFRLTEITGKALAVQGGSAQEASGALRQLSQSFSSGIVRAEEFNSILEGAFPLALAAANGLDEAAGSVGRLRNLVVEGKVTSQEFFQAILEGGAQLDEQFENTVPTVSQAFTNLQTAVISFSGQLDTATGFTSTLAQLILDLADSLDFLGRALTGNLEPTDELSDNLEKVAIAGILVGSTFQGLFDLLGVLKAAFVDFGESLGAIAAAASQAIQGNFQEALDILNEPAFDDTQAAFTDFFESLEANVDSASARISEVLLPAFRGIREESEEINNTPPPRPVVDQAQVDAVNEARDAVDEYLASLEQAETELALQAQLGDDAAEAIRQYREDLALAAATNEIFGDLVPTQEVQELQAAFQEFARASIESQRQLREEIEAAELSQSFEDQIDALEEEIELLGASNEELALNAEARALAAGATEEQAARIGELTETLLEEQDALRRETATLEGFFEEVGASAQRTLSGFLADPLEEGLDELPFKFAKVLQQLAADALASEFLQIIQGFFSGLGGGGAGGGGGGFLGFLGGLFGGGFAAGGQVTGGRPILVGERGPELFTPPSSGSIVPNVNINQAAQAAPTVNVINVSDPGEIPAGIETPDGEQAVINVIQRNPDQVRRLLG